MCVTYVANARCTNSRGVAHVAYFLGICSVTETPQGIVGESPNQQTGGIDGYRGFSNT